MKKTYFNAAVMPLIEVVGALFTVEKTNQSHFNLFWKPFV